jgi:hypothetical protein
VVIAAGLGTVPASLAVEDGNNVANARTVTMSDGRKLFGGFGVNRECHSFPSFRFHSSMTFMALVGHTGK